MSDIATQAQPPSVLAEIRSPAFRDQLAAALPEGISPDRFARITVTALLDDQARQRDPSKQLLACDRLSLYQAVIKCAQDGLMPDGRQAALVKRGDKVVYQPMVAGLRAIAAEYGWTIRGTAVHEKDEFDYTDEPPSLYHKVFTAGARGELVYAYAVARHRDGRREQRVMTRDEVLKRAASATTKQVWESWPDEMWAKTPVRDLFQELPLDPNERLRLERVLAADPVEELYGPHDSAEVSSPPAAVEQETGEVPQTPDSPVSDLDEEPGPAEPPTVVDADIDQLADAASSFIPPNGKYGPDGAHGPKTLAEILALGDDGERWVKWALSKISEPPEYAVAVWSFARVHVPGAYQEALARREVKS